MKQPPIQNPTETPAPSIRYLKGVGPKRALALEKFGIHSVQDLFYFFPRRYEDRSCLRTIETLTAGETVTLRGEILKVNLIRLRQMLLLEVVVGDKTGSVHAVWFNQAYLKNQFSTGQEIILYGKADFYQNRLQIASPEFEIVDAEEESVHTGRITPIYPLTEGLFQKSLRATIREAIVHQLDRNIFEWLPAPLRLEKNLLDLPSAIQEMHFPTSFEKLGLARRRIVFDEFLLFEITLLKKIENLKTKYLALRLTEGESFKEKFFHSLPFTLTQSQAQSIENLICDLKQPVPMNRLLQGDVGSGKTVVAAFAFLVAAESHRQAAFLVPTEILAEQHYRNLTRALNPFGISIGLLTSSTPDAKRERLLAELKQGKLSVIVGTHSLLSPEVRFQSLALVAIDEQHKFGVHQRCQLLNADPRPHQLVMTATPIPRTLALTLYGDLDVSVMKELPAGRKPVKTYWIPRAKQREILFHILKKIKEGNQAYFIFPLIEETEKSDLLAAKREFEHLRSGLFKEVKMGLVHGRLTAEERDAVMKSFQRGEIQILVATSVIEVGVDHPNATIMVIENAERFGLSQLHQMRGRIGRGDKPSECFLFGEPKTEDGKRRLDILTKTQDGFLIAEEDLKLRGPGDFWGTRQSGEPYFRVAHPINDQDVLLEARETALEILKSHQLETPEWAPAKKYLEQFSIRY